MDVRAHYARLFAHDAWANGELLKAFARMPDVPEKALGRFAHLLSAERLWLERLEQQPQTTPVWPTPDLTRAAEELAALTRDWRAYIERLDDAALAREVGYKNTRGELWTNRVGDVLEHVLLHSQYHRGQIASDLRSAGHVPPMTDFIHAVRSRLV